MRDAVYSLLNTDTQLQSLGGTGFVVEAQFSYDQIPNAQGAFLVIVWRTTDYAIEIQSNGVHHFDVYAHLPVKVSTDFVWIDNLLDRCDQIFAAVEDGVPVAGADGWQLEYVGFQGRSLDQTDGDYQTICRSASYYALGSKTT